MSGMFVAIIFWQMIVNVEKKLKKVPAMMNAKKVVNVVALICSVCLALAGMATTTYAETGAVANQPVVAGQASQDFDDLLNDELLGEIEDGDDELSNEELFDDYDEGRIEILIYEDFDGKPAIAEFFI